jgi:hypothetical protein
MISACLHFPDRILDAFDNAYHEMQKLYDDDNLDEVYESAQVLLADAAIPRYHRMRTLMLLSNFTSDLNEAQRYHAEAEAMLRIIRGQHVLGGNPVVDNELSFCRRCLDEVAEVLGSQRAEKFGKKGKSAQ